MEEEEEQEEEKKLPPADSHSENWWSADGNRTNQDVVPNVKPSLVITKSHLTPGMTNYLIWPETKKLLFPARCFICGFWFFAPLQSFHTAPPPSESPPTGHHGEHSRPHLERLANPLQRGGLDRGQQAGQRCHPGDQLGALGPGLLQNRVLWSVRGSAGRQEAPGTSCGGQNGNISVSLWNVRQAPLPGYRPPVG